MNALMVSLLSLLSLQEQILDGGTTLLRQMLKSDLFAEGQSLATPPTDFRFL